MRANSLLVHICTASLFLFLTSLSVSSCGYRIEAAHPAQQAVVAPAVQDTIRPLSQAPVLLRQQQGMDASTTTLAQKAEPAALGQSDTPFQRCLSGRLGCKMSYLTPRERALAEEAGHARNYQACQEGRSGLLGCDPSQLTQKERSALLRLPQEHTYEVCTGPGLACDSFQLSDQEWLGISQPQRVPYLLQGQKSRSPEVAQPRCAENGSCCGDISAKTNRPKTVLVSGSTRQDGTYTQGYYRSPSVRH